MSANTVSVSLYGLRRDRGCSIVDLTLPTGKAKDGSSGRQQDITDISVSVAPSIPRRVLYQRHLRPRATQS